MVSTAPVRGPVSPAALPAGEAARHPGRRRRGRLPTPEVEPGAEGLLTGPGDDADPQVRVVPEIDEGIGPLRQRLRAEGIHDLRPVDGEDGDLTFLLIVNGHCVLLSVSCSLPMAMANVEANQALASR